MLRLTVVNSAFENIVAACASDFGKKRVQMCNKMSITKNLLNILLCMCVLQEDEILKNPNIVKYMICPLGFQALSFIYLGIHQNFSFPSNVL